MMNEIIKSEIKQMMKQADSSNGDLDFLEMFGRYREHVVFTARIITDDEFDKLCEEVLEEI